MIARKLYAVRSLTMVILLGLGVVIARADAVTEGQELAKQALAAEQAGDHVAAVALFQKALALRPNHPGLTRRLVVASLRAGRVDDAFRALEDYAAMGLNADIATDVDLAKLPAGARLTALISRFADNAKPKGAVTIAATLSEPELLAEGLAHDAAKGRIYVGSIRKRKIVAVEPSGAVRDFVTTAADGLWGALGLALDNSGVLWVASSAMPQVQDLAPADKDRVGVFAFDAKARLKTKALLAPDGREHVLGDVIVSSRGDVYTTDSVGPTIYEVKGEALAPFLSSDTFHSLQGQALSGDERKLAVADYSSGVHIVDLATKSHVTLPMPAHVTLHGVDGLVRHGRDLIGVQNGVDPQRVILIRLNPAWNAIEGAQVLAANLPEMDEPTLAAPAGQDLLIVGNSQWSRFGDDGQIKGSEPFAPTRIVRLRLPPARQ